MHNRRTEASNLPRQTAQERVLPTRKGAVKAAISMISHSGLEAKGKFLSLPMTIYTLFMLSWILRVG